MKNRLCISYCDGDCGLDFDPDDMETWPSSVDEQGLCLDDGYGEDSCDEFYSEDEPSS